MSIWYYLSAMALFLILLAVTKKIGLSLLIPYVFLVFAATVFSRGTRTVGYQLIPFASYRKALTSSDYRAEILCNVLMFIPIGILMPETLRECRKEYGLGRCVLNELCLSVLIEILQLLTHRGFCETDDLISNIIGLLTGFGLFVLGSIIVREFAGKQAGDQ